MKDTTYNQRRDGTWYRKGDDWSERIANGVAGRLGLPAARTELAVAAIDGDLRYGVISKSVLSAAADDMGDSEEELVDGNELLLDPVIDGDRTGYTIEAVRECRCHTLALRWCPCPITANAASMRLGATPMA